MHKLKSNYITLTDEQRLYRCELPIIGLTGGIATGKSTASKYLAGLGIPVIDADHLIHTIYAQQETIEFVSSIATDSVKNSQIDFKSLRSAFFKNADLKDKLESFLYQRMPAAFEFELAKYKESPFSYIVYDVPLLFEKNLQSKVDLNILIYADRGTQKDRLMKRDQQTPQQADAILSHQLDIEKKREMAQFCVRNTSNISDLESRIQDLLNEITL